MTKVKIAPFLLSLQLLVVGCGKVYTGEAGFFTTWGEVSSKEPISEGLHLYCPIWSSLEIYDIRNQTRTFQTDVFTKDIQGLQLVVSVTYHLEKNKVIDIHSKTGRNYEDILIKPAVIATTKDVIGKIEADDLVGRRDEATRTIEETLRKNLEDYGIKVELIKLLNIDFSDTFERAVEEKQVALQKSIKEKNETARLQEVAKQKIVNAEAEARSKVLESEAEAKAILIKAEAEAKAIRMKNESLSDSSSFIQYIWASRWDGKMPMMMSDGKTIPMFDLKNMYSSSPDKR